MVDYWITSERYRQIIIATKWSTIGFRARGIARYNCYQMVDYWISSERYRQITIATKWSTIGLRARGIARSQLLPNGRLLDYEREVSPDHNCYQMVDYWIMSEKYRQITIATKWSTIGFETTTLIWLNKLSQPVIYEEVQRITRWAQQGIVKGGKSHCI